MVKYPKLYCVQRTQIFRPSFTSNFQSKDRFNSDVNSVRARYTHSLLVSQHHETSSPSFFSTKPTRRKWHQDFRCYLIFKHQHHCQPEYSTSCSTAKVAAPQRRKSPPYSFPVIIYQKNVARWTLVTRRCTFANIVRLSIVGVCLSTKTNPFY